VERSHAFRVLESVGGNKVRAAEILGVSRTKLYRILGDSDSPEASLTAPTDLSENSN
jgi:DNA-binding NtrC family response regulator